MIQQVECISAASRCDNAPTNASGPTPEILIPLYMPLKSPKLFLQFTLPLPKRCHFIRTSECWESEGASSVMESCFSSQNLDLHNMTSTRNSKTKRKFSDEQIKSLEIMFEAESRPESRRKQQLANELGLQPHQVAIWFQNRRARLKTKQIELEYRILKASYDTLASSFESLERERQSLLLQVHYNSKHK